MTAVSMDGGQREETATLVVTVVMTVVVTVVVTLVVTVVMTVVVTGVVTAAAAVLSTFRFHDKISKRPQ